MNQIIFRLAIAIIIIAALIQSEATNALFMLIVAGIVPGTEYVIPANIMMLAYSTLICAILFYSTAKEVLRAIFSHHIQLRQDADQNSPAKRRFKLI